MSLSTDNCRGAHAQHLLFVNSGFSETVAWIQAIFYGKLPICQISRPLLALLDCVSRAFVELAIHCAASGAFGTPQLTEIRQVLASYWRVTSQSSEKRFTTVAKVWGTSFTKRALFSHFDTANT